MNELNTPPGHSAGRLARALIRGERRALVDALALMDDRRPQARSLAAIVLDALPRAASMPTRHVVGITGSPGAGKSTLVAALAHHWREQDLSVGVLAVDPSSTRHGGALLGDRLRMQLATADDRVFVRSLADRGTTGGLAREVLPMVTVMLAVFDRLVVETVGVGQRETDVARLVDTTCLVLQPGAGDRVQMLKSGIMEVPDLLVLNKVDLGALAQRTRADLDALPGRAPLHLTSAVHGSGIEELASALEAHRADLARSAELVIRRSRAAADWLVTRLAEEYGTHGIARLGGRHAIETRLRQDDCACLTALAAERQRIQSLLGTPVPSSPLDTRFTSPDHRNHSS